MSWPIPNHGPVTMKDFEGCLEKLFRSPSRKDPADWLYISSSMLTEVKAGKLDEATLIFSNGCIFKGKTLRQMLEDDAKIRHAQNAEPPDVRA